MPYYYNIPSIKKLLKYTAIGSITLSDHLTVLLANRQIDDDLDSAMQTYPIILPIDLPIWKEDKAIAHLNIEFNKWYKTANNTQRRLISIEALSNNFCTLDYYCEDIYANKIDEVSIYYLMNRYRQQINRCINSLRDYHPQKFLDWFIPWNIADRKYHDMIIYYRKFLKYNIVLDKPVKKVLWRSYKLLCSLTPDAASFIKGKLLLIKGPRFYFGLQLQPHTLLLHTASPPNDRIPFDMYLFDHNLFPLAAGCIYFSNMPILDQAAAIILNITHPDDELDLIKTARWCNYTTYYEYSELKKILKRRTTVDFQEDSIIRNEIDYPYHNPTQIEDHPHADSAYCSPTDVSTNISYWMLPNTTFQVSTLQTLITSYFQTESTQFPGCPIYTQIQTQSNWPLANMQIGTDPGNPTASIRVCGYMTETIKDRAQEINAIKSIKEKLIEQLHLSDKGSDYFCREGIDWHTLRNNERRRDKKLEELEKLAWITDEPVREQLITVRLS